MNMICIKINCATNQRPKM